MQSRISRILGLGLTIAVLLTGSAALAQGSGEEKVSAGHAGPAGVTQPPRSQYINIRVDDVPNLNPAVAYASGRGEFLVVWEEHIHGNRVAIYGRRVGMNARPLGPAFPIADDNLNQYSRPAVAYSPREEHYLVVWMRRHSAEDYDIWAVPVRWDGVRGTRIPIDADTDRDWYPAVAYNSHDNEFLVVYEKLINDSRRDIEAQRVRASNWTLASWRNLGGGSDQIRRLPDVAYNRARNEYLISYVYQTPPMPPLRGDVVARRTNANMGWLSDEFYVSPTGSPPQGSIAIAAGHDAFMAVWDEEHGANQDSVWARRLSGTGSPFPFINVAHIADRHNFESTVAHGNGGRYLLVWRTVVGTQPNWNWNIAGRMVRAGQNAPEGPLFAVDETAGMQRNPDLACSSMDPCLVVYEDDWPGDGDYEIRGVLIGHRRISLPLVLRRR